MRDLELVLRLIAKRDGEGEGEAAFPVSECREYGVTIAAHYDEGFVPALQRSIEALYPGASVVVARFPREESGDKLRLLLAALLQALGQPAPTREQTTIDLSSRVRPAVWQAADFLIVDNADLLDLHCLHYLRRDQGMAPVMLVGRSGQLLTLLWKDEVILRRALFVDAETIALEGPISSHVRVDD